MMHCLIHPVMGGAGEDVVPCAIDASEGSGTRTSAALNAWSSSKNAVSLRSLKLHYFHALNWKKKS
jgi:hypothetical protein